MGIEIEALNFLEKCIKKAELNIKQASDRNDMKAVLDLTLKIRIYRYLHEKAEEGRIEHEHNNL